MNNPASGRKRLVPPGSLPSCSWAPGVSAVCRLVDCRGTLRGDFGFDSGMGPLGVGEARSCFCCGAVDSSACRMGRSTGVGTAMLRCSVLFSGRDEPRVFTWRLTVSPRHCRGVGVSGSGPLSGPHQEDGVSRTGIVLACAGVFLISWAGVDISDPVVAWGVAFSLVAGVLWAFYMWLGRRVAVGGQGLDTLAWAMACAAIIYTPVGIPGIGPLLADWKLLVLLVVVGFVTMQQVPMAWTRCFCGVFRLTFAYSTHCFLSPAWVVGLVMLKQVPCQGRSRGWSWYLSPWRSRPPQVRSGARSENRYAIALPTRVKDRSRPVL